MLVYECEAFYFWQYTNSIVISLKREQSSAMIRDPWSVIRKTFASWIRRGTYSHDSRIAFYFMLDYFCAFPNCKIHIIAYFARCFAFEKVQFALSDALAECKSENRKNHIFKKDSRNFDYKAKERLWVYSHRWWILVLFKYSHESIYITRKMRFLKELNKKSIPKSIWSRLFDPWTQSIICMMYPNTLHIIAYSSVITLHLIWFRIYAQPSGDRSSWLSKFVETMHVLTIQKCLANILKDFIHL
jgi:hypothetical protein